MLLDGMIYLNQAWTFEALPTLELEPGVTSTLVCEMPSFLLKERISLLVCYPLPSLRANEISEAISRLVRMILLRQKLVLSPSAALRINSAEGTPRKGG